MAFACRAVERLTESPDSDFPHEAIALVTDGQAREGDAKTNHTFIDPPPESTTVVSTTALPLSLWPHKHAIQDVVFIIKPFFSASL